jgi:hypothetical protein
VSRVTRKAVAALLLALALPGASWLDAANYIVSGVVVDSRSRTPLANVRVSLAPTTAREQKVENVTKQDGRFSFAVSRAGKYGLWITKPGYPSQAYRQSGYARVESAIVVRDDQDTRNIIFEANRGGAIVGQIKDEDSEGVGRALVAVFQSLIVGGERKIVARGQARANAAGEFRLANLPRGNYYVCAMGRPWFADALIQAQQAQESLSRLPKVNPQAGAATDPAGPSDEPPEPDRSPPEYSPDPGFRGTAFLTTFFPQGQSVEEASLVRLEAGSETQVSITLPLVKGVSVNGAVRVPGEMGDGRTVLYKKVYDQSVGFLEGWVQKDGSFQFKNVPAGSYEIVATSQSSSGASSWNIRQEVEVGAFDVEVALRPPQMGSLSGRVFFEGERPASTTDLFVSLRNEKGNLVRTEISPEGKFSLTRLPAGRYEVTAGNLDYIAAYMTGPAGQRLPLNLEIASGETIPRDLTLTRAASVIEGTVERAGVPQLGAFVLLLPKDQSQRWAYRVDQTDSDGSYRLSTVPSGDYFLIALTNGEDVAYRDAKVALALTPAGQLVHVEPGDHLDMKLDVVSAASLHLPSL